MSNMRKSINDATPQDWNRANRYVTTKTLNEGVDVYTSNQSTNNQSTSKPTVRSSITTDAKARKLIPIHTTVLSYFPQAVAEVAKCCVVGGAQHGQEIDQLNWDRSKSGGELDALCRHLLDAGHYDSDGIRHSAKIAFRALANLQLELERDGEA